MQVRSRQFNDGVTLTELMIAIVAGAILMLGIAAIWELSHRQNVDAQARMESSRVAFAVLERIKQDVLRAKQIEVPDPDYPAESSIQVRVETEAGTVRRAFRLDSGRLVVDMKDEAAGLVTVFNGIGALEFTVLDSPVNSRVAITCTVNVDGESTVLQSVVMKRN